jgi:hypothetical protein
MLAVAKSSDDSPTKSDIPNGGHHVSSSFLPVTAFAGEININTYHGYYAKPYQDTTTFDSKPY